MTYLPKAAQLLGGKARVEHDMKATLWDGNRKAGWDKVLKQTS